jgi:large repetitive protein
VTFSLANGVGTATCTTTLLTAAVHGITAIYSGNSNYLGSPISPPTSVTVGLGNSATSVSALPTSSTVDQSVAITGVVVPNPAVGLAANVVPFSAAGTLAFFDGANAIANCGAVNLTYNAGAGSASATCLTSALTAQASPHSLIAKYSGDTNYNASNSGGQTFNVVKSGSTTTLTSSSNPAPVNASVIFTATVAPLTGTAAVGIGGNVEILSGGTAITGCTAQPVIFSSATLLGTATCNTQFLASPTAYTITAVYLGDPNYSTSNALGILESVGKTSAITTLASVPVSGASIVNQSVTFTESVASPTVGGAAPGGTVTFTNNGNTIVGCTGVVIKTGAAACATTLLSAGVHTIEATYSGDTNYAITTNTSIQTVTAIASAVATVSSSGVPPVPTVVNQTVTFTATVTPAPSATRVPLTGNVAFTDNGNPLAGCVPQFNSTTGIATCTDTTLLPGPHSIVATYSGDISYTTGSSTAVVQQVNQATATVGLISSTNPSGVNQSVTFTATVSAATQPIGLSGSVSFTDNGNPIAACPAVKVSNIGVATCTTAALTQGMHTIAASYGGDTNFTAPTPATVTQTVEAAFTTTLLASSVPTGATSTVDSPVTLTATVTSAKGSALLLGSVAFTYNAGTIPGCSAIKVNTAGVAVCPTSALVAGSDVIVATYGHDTSFSGSSATLTLTVNQASTTLTMVPQGTILVANPKGINDTVTFTATITSTAFATAASAAIPLTGNASFADNDVPIPGCTSLPINPATGTAICTTSALGGGSDTILATYQGDPNYIAASGKINQLVSDYSLALFTTPPVVITQGFTTVTDPIAPKTITLAPTPISGYSGELNLTCTVTASAAAAGAVAPGCTLPTPAKLAVAASGVQQSVPIIIDATNASPGIFAVQVIGTDQHNGLTHNLALPLQVSVSSTNSLTVISGATTNNTGTVKFVLPAGVGLTGINCLSVSGPTLSTPVKPSALNMSCIINPDTVSKSGSTQEVSVSVTVDTGGAAAAQLAGHSTILTAGLLGIPVLVLIGLVRRRRFAINGGEIFRLLAIFAIVVGGLQAIGCGGSFKRVSTGASGQTPPGSYDLLIQGTGTDTNHYEAVLKVNVTL